MYDQFGHAGANANAGAGGFDGGFSGFSGSAGFDSDFFNEMFGDFFGGRAASRTRQQKGRDLQYQINVNLSEVAFGAEKSINITKLETCEVCNGTGAKAGSQPKTCPDCHGAGQVRFSRGFFATVQTCPRCKGTGEIIDNPCTNCHGQKVVRKTKNIKVKIPAGVDTGVTLRLRGEGDAGIKGAQNGDLFVVLNVINDTKFEREDANLHLRQNISFSEASLGTEIEVETIDGKAKMKIPAGTQNGTTFRLKEKGLPVMSTKRRGDLLVKINVSVPKKLTKEQKEAILNFAKLSGENIEKFNNEKDGFMGKIFK